MSEVAIHFNQIKKIYGKKTVLNIDDLKVKKGDFFAFVGPNGAGKTTAINILLNFKLPTSGSAKIMGLDVSKSTKEIHHQVGYIPSEIALYDIKVGTFLNYAQKFHSQIDKQYKEQLINKLNVDIDAKIKNLSLGNKKKVAIVAALMHKPKILIMDEPTSGLDPIVQDIFFKMLKDMQNEGVTIFMSSHNLEDVEKYSDHVAFINKGEIIEVINVANMKKEMGYSAYGFDQLGGQVIFQNEKDINELIKKLNKIDLKQIIVKEETINEKFNHLFNDSQEVNND